jgi:hypothetical protein
MVSLSYRTFANYIVEDNLAGLRVFLENRHVVVDDRDEVSPRCLSMMDRPTFSCHDYGFLVLFIERSYCTGVGIDQRQKCHRQRVTRSWS